MEKKQILLVEDDRNLGLVLKDFLEMEGFEVILCDNGEKGKEAFTNNSFNLAILDIMLPLLDGFTLGEYIRKENDKLPLIFLSAKAMKEDRIKGLKIGADDYITKPFSTEELILRINAVLRRSQMDGTIPNESATIHIGNYIFNYSEQTLDGNDTTKQLTRKEADVLNMLCKYKNRLLKRETALKEIWGENDYFMGRSMDVYIAKLRKMLKSDPRISIDNVHNSGFRLSVKED